MDPKGRGALLALGLVFLIMGLVLRSIALVGLVVPIAVILAAGHFCIGAEPELSAAWEMPCDDLMEGEEIAPVLRLRNLSERSTSFLAEIDIPPEAVIKVGRRKFPVHLKGGEELILHLQIQFPRRGKYDLGGVKVTWNDPFALHRRSRTVPAEGRCKVVPLIDEHAKSPFHLDRVCVPSGNVRSRLIDRGLEFHSIREYVPGDERRRINWKATARSENVLINLQHAERCGDIVLIVDARTSVGNVIRTKEQLDGVVDAACSLSSQYLRQRDRVGLLVMRDVLDIELPRYGRKQFDVIVDQLLKVRRGSGMPALGLGRVVQRYFPNNSFLLVISPADDAVLVQGIKELSLRGRRVGLLAISPADGPEDEAEALRRRMDMMRWKDDIDELGDYCQVVEWSRKARSGGDGR